MCGRIAQYRLKAAYAAEIGWDSAAFPQQPDDPPPNWNAAPGAPHWLMHRLDDTDRMDWVGWGYRPAWAAEKNLSIAINARIEKAATGAFFRSLWKSGRAIVPADGWYEWSGEPRHKQPWYIRLESDRPMFMAALASFRANPTPREDTGFVIVTAAADGGLVDVHDRRPVVFSAQDAALWMDPNLSPDQAEYLARTMSLPPAVFAWYPVSKDVNKAGTNGPHLIDALEA